MGTSGRSGGPSSQTPLVPSWLEPAAPPAPPDGGAAPERGPNPHPDPRQPLPPIPPSPPPGRFKSARTNFSSFARSGGRDVRALRRAVGQYARSGTGGSGNATRRMGASRATASLALGVLRDFQRDGVVETLRRLDLADLVGRPLEDIFIGLTDTVCGDGGSIDEGIAREAWLETVAELHELHVANPADLTPDDMRTIFLTFVAHSIVGRLLQDIGANGFKFAGDLADVEAFDEQLRSYIRRSVEDSFSGDLTAPAALSDEQIGRVVDQTYREAWDLLQLQGDAAE